MSDISLRKIGRVGLISLNRAEALNALTWDMIREIRAILPQWSVDNDVSMVVIVSTNERAFCAGGDIADIYAALTNGDSELPRRFWAEEYQLNAALFNFPRPIATFMHGFTMGGGVGVGCHGSHRIVGATSQIAMPECSIGLVPDVGGSLLLARAPGRLGEFLGTTAARMTAGDAIHAGFADYYIPEKNWPDLIAQLEATGDWEAIDAAALPPPKSALAAQSEMIDQFFGGETLRDIVNALSSASSEWAQDILAKLSRNAPLAMACGIEVIHRARATDEIAAALAQEYRFVHRVVTQGDFREGIRAAIVDRDKSPKWAHDSPSGPSPAEVSAMLMPLGEAEWRVQQ